MALSRLTFVKLLELVLTLTCLVLHYNSMGDVSGTNALLVSGTFVGFTIILVALFAGYLMSTPVNKRLDLFFSAAGCALFIISGVILFQYWNDESLVDSTLKLFGSDRKAVGMTKAILSIVNGIIFAVDAFFTCRD